MATCTEDSVSRLIYFTAMDMRRYAEKALKPFDLTMEQFHILKNTDMELGQSQRNLGEMVNKTPANMTRILDRLQTKGLITRQAAPTDRRTTLVLLTNKGHDLTHEVIGILEAFSGALVQGISQQKQDLVKNVLLKITENLQSMSDSDIQ